MRKTNLSSDSIFYSEQKYCAVYCVRMYQCVTVRVLFTLDGYLTISRNGPYKGGHLAFYFKLNFKQVYNVL